MKVILFVAFLASASLGCVVPSLTTLDHRLAAIGAQPRPYPWTIEAQVRIRDSKEPQSTAKNIAWSSDLSAGVVRIPDRGESTRALNTVRVSIENEFVISGLPSKFSTIIAQTLKPFGGSVKGSEARLYIHSLDCSQRSKGGPQSLACDLEVGPEGKTLLSIANGNMDVKGGQLTGDVTNHDSSAKDESIRFELMCPEQPTGETFTLGLVFTGNKVEHKDSPVELLLHFKAATSASIDDEAPTSVVGADGTRVFLLRGNTFLTRWIVPLAYGLALITAIKYLSGYVAAALRPKKNPAPQAPPKK